MLKISKAVRKQVTGLLLLLLGLAAAALLAGCGLLLEFLFEDEEDVISLAELGLLGSVCRHFVVAAGVQFKSPAGV